jgi:ppGpp synthetase/RelA/SpoT-type nucleotidyltranferase
MNIKNIYNEREIVTSSLKTPKSINAKTQNKNKRFIKSS